MRFLTRNGADEVCVWVALRVWSGVGAVPVDHSSTYNVAGYDAKTLCVDVSARIMEALGELGELCW